MDYYIYIDLEGLNCVFCGAGWHDVVNTILNLRARFHKKRTAFDYLRNC
jgi:hypothetical protein